MSELQDIPIGKLVPHPDNPRLQMREDVVERLAAEIQRTGFGREHALLVRPHNGAYQIVSGHHRAEAAERAGVDELPCWVREMDDDEAFMLLVLSNTQGELSPLEIGMHALIWQGEQKEYAERSGYGKSYISQLRSAAEVASVYSSKPDGLDEKAKHLYEVSRAPRAAWSALVGQLVKHGWTVADVKRKVDELKRFEVPDHHAAWLPLAEVVAAYLADGRPTSTAVERLISTADGILDHIDRDGEDDDRGQFADWLTVNSGADSWDHRKLADYHANLIREWSERAEEIDDGRIRIEHCRASELIDTAGIEAGSVDLIFTDPPYPVEFVDCWTELAELAVKALKPGGLLVAYTGQYTMLEALDRLRAAGLSYYWTYAVSHDGAFFRMNATRVQCGWKPLLVFRNGQGSLPNWHKDFVADGSREKADHEWQQSEAEAAYWISELSKPDELVVDPFVGGGTTPAVCKQLGRRFVGCDVDQLAVQRTKERVT